MYALFVFEKYSDIKYGKEPPIIGVTHIQETRICIRCHKCVNVYHCVFSLKNTMKD